MAGNAFGVWLERQLRSRELNQSEFARKLGMKQGMVSNWVRGARIPDPGSCDRIADALGLPLDEVLIQAGHRPRLGDVYEGELGELVTLFNKLSKVDQYYVLDFARFRWERAQHGRGEVTASARDASHVLYNLTRCWYPTQGHLGDAWPSECPRNG